MENKKDIIKQAISEMEHFANMVNESVTYAKGTVVKDQIKEALNEEEDFDEEDVDTALDQDSEEATDGVDVGDIETEIEDADTEEPEIEIEDEPSTDLDLGDADDSDIELEDEDYDVVDLTQAPNEEVIKVFKDMSNSDEIEIVGDEVNITDPESGNTYKIVTGGGAEEVPAETDADLDLDLDGEAEDTEDLDLDIDGFDDAEEDAEGEEADLDLDAEEDAEEAPAEDEETEDAEEDDEEIVFEVELNHQKSKKAINESSDKMRLAIYRWIMDKDYLQNAHEWYTNQTAFLEIGLSEFMEANGISENQYDALVELAEKVVNEIGYYQWNQEDDTLDEQIPVGNAQARRVTAAKEIRGAGAKQLAEEVAKLKAENKVLAENYANSLKALELFKEKIIETKVHTKNLAAITKLFLEFTTTQAEKKQIVESLTSAKTIEESNVIEKRLISELSKKSNITESVNKAINNNIATSTSKSVIQEAAYVDPQLARMRDMMGL